MRRRAALIVTGLAGAALLAGAGGFLVARGPDAPPPGGGGAPLGTDVAGSFRPGPVDCGPDPCTSGPLLPDLVQVAPYDVGVTTGPDGPRLGFASAVSNLGVGPLLIEGRRHGARARHMRADQVVRHGDGTVRRLRGVGRLEYVRSPDHAHWHFAPFEVYELVGPDRDGRVVRSGKTGFCLGDRYRDPRAPAGAPAEMVFTSRCGLGAVGRRLQREGISVGFGDSYPAHLEGQSIPLRGLPGGRYTLVHRVDPGRRLRDADRRNNVASLALELRWRDGAPSVRTLTTCVASERCPAGPGRPGAGGHH